MGQGCRIAESVSLFRHPHQEPDRGIVLGDEVILLDQVRLLIGDLRHCPSAGLWLGNRVIINVGCYLSGEGGLHIGDGVLIGAHARILSAGHDLDGPEPWIINNRLTYGPVRIGAGAWIGAGATLLQGRTVGTGAVIGAGSVVTRDVPDFAVVAGNPARLLRRRWAQPRRGWRGLLDRLGNRLG